MTRSDPPPPGASQPSTGDAETFAQNMARVAEQCQQLWQDFVARQGLEGNTPATFDPLNIGAAFSELFTQLLRDPVKLWERQFGLWQDYMQLWQSEAQKLLGDEQPPVIAPDSKDKRFRDEAWQQNAVFDFLKQSYLLTARAIQQTVGEVQGLDAPTAHKIDFYTRQFVDAMSPSNYLMTNPEVLKATLETKGENLVRGLQNLLEDFERGHGQLRIRMSDENAFALGKNLALTPGQVVYENALMQLIQYAPSTEQVYRTPLLVIPAWINKYYILDLQPENSIIKYLVDQGYTVFVISWVNPDETLSKKSFDDYMGLGPLAALDAIRDATGEESVSIAAYCLGGTLTAVTLAWLAAKKQAHRVNSVTYLTTLVDFSEAGDLSVFIDEEQLKILEGRMAQTGYLDGSEMAMTFNMLRANDLIWSFVVNNYLLGKDPFPFDLLYWNADSTRMPAAMHSFYLRNMYQNNRLVQPGALTIGGVPIDLKQVATPTYLLSTREDHIAPWKSTYAATQIYAGPKRFVLGGSGHIAGIINPPVKKKYGYWVNDKLPALAEEWLKDAKETAGSWWPDWLEWHKAYRGEKVPARRPGDGKLTPIEPAPGRYVQVKS